VVKQSAAGAEIVKGFQRMHLAPALLGRINVTRWPSRSRVCLPLAYLCCGTLSWVYLSNSSMMFPVSGSLFLLVPLPGFNPQSPTCPLLFAQLASLHLSKPGFLRKGIHFLREVFPNHPLKLTLQKS
jgi:hypothetical protein